MKKYFSYLSALILLIVIIPLRVNAHEIFNAHLHDDLLNLSSMMTILVSQSIIFLALILKNRPRTLQK
jgi:hypothetical protein